MSKRKINSVNRKAVKALETAYDLIEGQNSNIPECCIEGYLNGRTYMNVRNSLPEKSIKKLSKWHYVPCEKCYKKNKRNELKMNGMSDCGKMIRALISILENDKYLIPKG